MQFGRRTLKDEKPKASNSDEPLSDDPTLDEPVPVAAVQSGGGSLVGVLRRHPSKVWFLTLVCLLIAVALSWPGFGPRATTITVRFEEGHGIKPGDRLQHRGIEVGEITTVTLNDSHSHVHVVIELEPGAAALARDGSRFWIERPRISLARVSGLETVVGAKYVGVLPGPQTGARETSFVGDETPPTLHDTETLDIRIRFDNGYGLAIGDVVKFRGIVVGEVVTIDLNRPLDGIDVQVRLASGGRRLARAGTRFWVERPRVQLTGVSGLDTLTSGRHIATVAGPTDAPEQLVFDGLEVPPPTLEQRPGGLEVVINSRDRQGIDSGAPLTYRGLRVGHVVSVGLSADAAQIETRLYVEPAYRQLIRQDSVFWSVGGFDASFGFGGLEVNSETLATIAAGGVALGTPDPPGPLAIVGSRFDLQDEPDGWRDWTPRIPIGTSLLPDGAMLPRPVRVSLVWKQRFLGIAQLTQADGWGLLLADGRLIGPANLLVPPEAAVGGAAALQFEGKNLTATAEQTAVAEGLAIRQLEDTPSDGWPLDRIRHMTAPEDCLIVANGIDNTRSLPAARFSDEDGRLAIDPSFTLPEGAHGASVVAVRDGALVGLIAIEAGRPQLLNVKPVHAR
jgi:hypothetical protein